MLCSSTVSSEHPQSLEDLLESPADERRFGRVAVCTEEVIAIPDDAIRNDSGRDQPADRRTKSVEIGAGLKRDLHRLHQKRSSCRAAAVTRPRRSARSVSFKG